MKRWALFIFALTLASTLAFAQATVTPSGQATQQGAAVPMAPISPPLVATPLMHLGVAPTQNVGTSTAAVTSTNPSATPAPPSAVPIRPEIDFGPQNVYVGPTNPTADNTNSSANTSGNATTTGRQVFDRGVHSGEVAALDDGTHGRSLGDIARENRQRAQSAQARTFTNADLDRMANAGGVSGTATSMNNATSAYPADNGVINPNGVAANAANGNAPAGVATPSNVPAATEQQNAQPATPFTPKAGTAQPQQKPSAAAPPQQMSQANTPANPADQNAAASSSTTDQNNGEQKTLPKSGSFLPLMAVVGLGATAAGLLSRK